MRNEERAVFLLQTHEKSVHLLPVPDVSQSALSASLEAYAKLTDLSDPTPHPDLAFQQPPTHTPTHTSVEDAQLVQAHHQTRLQDAAKS